MINVDKVFVAHVKGETGREEKINKLLASHSIDFEYMLNGDKCDITDDILDRYFEKGSEMYSVSAVTSCALKHILIMEEIVKQNLSRVLVLEDDVVLAKDFVNQINKSLSQLESQTNKEEASLVYYETTFHHFIPRSKRKKGVMLYLEKRGLQCTACYITNREYAEKFLAYIKQNKCSVPIDVYIDSLRQNGTLPTMFQCHPDLCRQSSHWGGDKSLIGNPYTIKRFGCLRYKFRYYFRKYILYNLR